VEGAGEEAVAAKEGAARAAAKEVAETVAAARAAAAAAVKVCGGEVVEVFVGVFVEEVGGWSGRLMEQASIGTRRREWSSVRTAAKWSGWDEASIGVDSEKTWMHIEKERVHPQPL